MRVIFLDTSAEKIMPAADEDDDHLAAEEPTRLTKLPFPPVTKSHILHCSYHYWHAK